MVNRMVQKLNVLEAQRVESD